MSLGGWEPGIGDCGVGTTGQHLWGLTNGVPLRSKKRSPEYSTVCGPGTLLGTFWGPSNGVPPRFPLL